MQFLMEPIPELAIPGVCDFLNVHLAIWQLRKHDLQVLFPLEDVTGRAQLLLWSVSHGWREYRALRDCLPFWQQLASPADLPCSTWSGGISRLMLLMAYANAIPLEPGKLHLHRIQRTLLEQSFVHGNLFAVLPPDVPLPAWQRRFLRGGTAFGMGPLANLIYDSRPDLQAAFDRSQPSGLVAFEAWLESHGKQETTWGRSLTIPAKQGAPVMPPSQTFGVNLFGYAFGELGIGEDVRMAAQALHAAGIPFVIVDFPPGAGVRQADRSVEHWVAPAPRFAIDMVCLTAEEHFRLYLERGADYSGARYVLGYWPWELAMWPAAWRPCFCVVDEIWASSRHTMGALVRAPAAPPVLHMPMAVTLPALPGGARARFGLPQESYLFVFSFDGKSTLARKNPGAVLTAFQRAFAPNDQTVGLVIKTMRPDPTDPIWAQIGAAAKNDRRIHIIDAVLDKAEVLSLYAGCDCFVSLHRAEGYGRGLAEALLLGLDLICTGYGGNTDFAHTARSEPVPYTLRPLAPGEYPHAELQFWAEPDVDAAARAMRKMAASAHEGPTRRPDASARFAATTIGWRYRDRLLEIGKALGLSDGATEETRR